MPRQETSADLPQGLVAGGAGSGERGAGSGERGAGSGERSFIDSSQKNFLHFRRERKLPDS